MFMCVMKIAMFECMHFQVIIVEVHLLSSGRTIYTYLLLYL